MENTNKTKPSKHLKINIHTNLQRLHQHPPDFHNSGTNEILELRGEVEKFPMPTQKLYLIDNYLDRENSFFYGIPLYIQATLNERLFVQFFSHKVLSEHCCPCGYGIFVVVFVILFGCCLCRVLFFLFVALFYYCIFCYTLQIFCVYIMISSFVLLQDLCVYA